MKQALQNDVDQTIIDLFMSTRNSLCMPSGSGAFPRLINLQAFINSSDVKGFWRCVFSFGGLRLPRFSCLQTFLAKVLFGSSNMSFFTTCLGSLLGKVGRFVFS